jgi:formyl-CoA transferase/succinyl-CoA--D-citramalate CoA-transferase
MARVDVVLENFRPGRLDEWGLGYDQLRDRNPGLVYVHVSGFGQSGPRSAEAGFGSIGEAVGGIRFTTGNPGLPPTRAGISLGDSLAALFAVIGTMAALNERAHSGVGQEVDVAIYEAVAAVMESSMADFEIAGHLRERTGSVLPGVAPSNVYPTADGSDIIIAGNADAVFRRLCVAMGRPDLADDERFATHVQRGEHMAELDRIVAAWTATHEVGALLELLADAGVPAGQIFTAADMLVDPQYAARDMVVRRRNKTGVEVPMTGVVPKFSRTPGHVGRPGPLLGEHTRATITELTSRAPDDIAQLFADGVLTEPAADT